MKRSAPIPEKSKDVTEENPAKRQKIESCAEASKLTDIILAKKTRATKPDFAPLYKKHRKILESSPCGVEIEKLIKVRRLIHQHPEGGFKEVETQKRVRETLLGFGLGADAIRDCAGTGLVVDIKGSGPRE